MSKVASTTLEAAQRLGLSRRTVQGYVSSKKLPAEARTKGFTQYYVIRREELERFALEYNMELTEGAVEDQ